MAAGAGLDDRRMCACDGGHTHHKCGVSSGGVIAVNHPLAIPLASWLPKGDCGLSAVAVVSLAVA